MMVLHAENFVFTHRWWAVVAHAPVTVSKTGASAEARRQAEKGALPVMRIAVLHKNHRSGDRRRQRPSRRCLATRWSDREASAKHLLDHRIECGHVNRFFQDCDTGLRRARIAADR